MSPQIIIVEEDYIGQRIDNFLVTRLKGLPKSRLYRALRSGEVRVNKKRIDASYRLQMGDHIRIPPLRLPDAKTAVKPSENFADLLEKSVIYEDNKLIIINKPSGVASHGGSGIGLGAIEAFRQLRPQTKFLELAHRLDRDTTGCLVMCKKPATLKELHQLFKEGGVEKTYLALVQNSWQGDERWVNAPLLKNQLSSGERIVKVHRGGKSAETLFKPLQLFPHATLLQAFPKTGRTHQIRVHAAHINHAILGDDKYGDVKASKSLGVRHLLLHAASLRFELSDRAIAICACLDEEFLRVLRKFQA